MGNLLVENLELGVGVGRLNAVDDAATDGLGLTATSGGTVFDVLFDDGGGIAAWRLGCGRDRHGEEKQDASQGQRK